MKKSFSVRKAAGLLTLLVFLCRPASAVSLVVNGDFETGDLSGWTLSGNSSLIGVTTGQAAHLGTFGAFAGPQDTLGFLSQNLATVSGQTYQLDFFLANNQGTPNTFQVSWGGSILMQLTNSPAFGYAHYTFSGLVAAGSSTPLQFGFRQDPDFWLLDDVTVVPSGTAAVPDDGATLALLTLALAGVIGVRRRFR